MTDLLTRIEEQPLEVLDVIASSMSIRAAEPAMQSICARYMGKVGVPNAHVLEVGCGNGAASKLIMQHMIPSTLSLDLRDPGVGAKRFDAAGLRGEAPPSLAGGIDDSLVVVMEPVREEALLEVEPHALDGI